jgi:hypothetical protein
VNDGAEVFRLRLESTEIMPTTPTPANVLRASLEQHNEMFENLLKLIPAQYYIVNEQKIEEQVCSLLFSVYYNLKYVYRWPINFRNIARSRKA